MVVIVTGSIQKVAVNMLPQQAIEHAFTYNNGKQKTADVNLRVGELVYSQLAREKSLVRRLGRTEFRYTRRSCFWARMTGLATTAGLPLFKALFL